MKFDGKQKKYTLTLLSLIFFCELLIKIDNIVIQSVGILLVPLIVAYTVLILTTDSKLQ